MGDIFSFHSMSKSRKTSFLIFFCTSHNLWSPSFMHILPLECQFWRTSGFISYPQVLWTGQFCQKPSGWFAPMGSLVSAQQGLQQYTDTLYFNPALLITFRRMMILMLFIYNIGKRYLILFLIFKSYQDIWLYWYQYSRQKFDCSVFV